MTKQSLNTIAAAIAMLTPAILVAQTSEAPRAVSPGSPVAAETLAGSCPAFSWSDVDGASGYELVLYRVNEAGDLETALQKQMPAGASSWTPSATQCPASDSRSGNQFAWAVRALTEDGAGAWSEPLLFATPGAPSEDEVRQALNTLRRYREGREGDGGEGLAPSRAPDADASGRDARRYLPGEPTSPPTTNDQQPTTTLADLEALSLSTLSATPSPQTVTTPSSFSLNLSGDVELGGSVFKDGAPFIHNDGGAPGRNTAVGLNALVSATPGSPSSDSGSSNSAFGYGALSANTSGFSNTSSGYRALFSNTSGFFNTASGSRALFSNTSGTHNTASGFQALFFNTTGYRNTAIGERALHSNTTGGRNTASGNGALFSNATGGRNTAIGYRALFSNTEGDYNTAIGLNAGYFWTTGNHNIAIGYGTQGIAGESGVIRIGAANNQTETFIEGISGTTVSGVEVMITAGDQLGVAASSARFKQDIFDLEGVSDRLLDLRPVSFRYKDQPDGSSAEAIPNPLEYGLIAEEVAAIFPELVVYDDEGNPFTVRNHLLTPLLLGEIQRHEGELAELRRTVADQRKRLDKLAKKKRFR